MSSKKKGFTRTKFGDNDAKKEKINYETKNITPYASKIRIG